MSTETKANLSEKTIEQVQDLISINIDSAKGFTAAADNFESATFASYFRECALERDAQARELQSVLRTNAERPTDSGSVKGTLHRWWLETRSALTGSDQHAILAEAERGEDAIKEAYEKVLKNNPGNALSDVLHAHMARVKRHHDRIRDLRDQVK